MIDRCPICAEPFKPEDNCATDIELGTCHFDCLDGSPVVDLETGEELPDQDMHSFPYSEVMDPLQSKVVGDIERLRNELESAASLFETLSEELPEDDVSGVMMSVMAKCNRSVLATTAPERHSEGSAIAQLHAIVDAWEALPGGRQVRNSDIEAWLGKHMGPGINAIRGFLRRPRPDGVLPPPPQARALGTTSPGKQNSGEER